jgi:uncharacterized protein (DUF302 family)
VPCKGKERGSRNVGTFLRQLDQEPYHKEYGADGKTREVDKIERGKGMPEDNGLIRVASHYPMDEILQRLENTFAEKGLQVFAVIDHGGEAAKVGLKMPPTKVLIFGSPKAGTPLMLAAPSLAIDLPLKALVAEDAQGKISVTYNDPEYLRARHGFPIELTKNLAGAGALIAKAVE